MSAHQPGLRPFLETIDNWCRTLDRDGLLQLIMNLAKQVEPGKREEFLDAFPCLLPGKDGQAITVAPARSPIEQLLAEFADLREEIEARVQSIGDGSYFDDLDEDEWREYDYYSDEDPDLLNAEQLTALAELFEEADQFFLGGNKAAARMLYEALFSLLDKIIADEPGFYWPDLEIEHLEERARFARCVYDLAAPAERIAAMLMVMRTTATDNGYNRQSLPYLPLLQDVIDAENDELAGFDAFLPAWLKALGTCDFTLDHLAELHLEAAFMLGGVAAVGDLARKWRDRQPQGYLHWLQYLQQETNWPALREASGEALACLTKGRERGKAAEFLITAGGKLGEEPTVLSGYREKFRSTVNERSLLHLVNEAERQQQRACELLEVCNFLGEQLHEYGFKELLTKALLMAGNIALAFSLCEQDKDLRVPANKATGLVFAAVLYLLSGRNSACSILEQMLREQSEAKTFASDNFDGEGEQATISCSKEILHGLALVDLTILDPAPYRRWTGTLGEGRINAILAGKHRGEYKQAAMILAALAETLAVDGDKKKAQNLLHEYCRVLYNRLIAFRREARATVGESAILRGIAHGL